MVGGTLSIIYPELSYKVIGILFEVYNNLGFGYKEVIYQKAIESELNVRGIKYKSQLLCDVRYKEKVIGKRYLDFLIEDKIILEIKKGDYYPRQNYTQVFEYLQLSGLELAIIANFTSNGVKHKRIVNTKKNN